MMPIVCSQQITALLNMAHMLQSSELLLQAPDKHPIIPCDNPFRCLLRLCTLSAHEFCPWTTGESGIWFLQKRLLSCCPAAAALPHPPVLHAPHLALPHHLALLPATQPVGRRGLGGRAHLIPHRVLPAWCAVLHSMLLVHIGMCWGIAA